MDPSSLLTMVAVESDWVIKAREMVQSDSYFDEINTKLEAGKLDPRLYQKRSGLIYNEGRVLIRPNSPLTQFLITDITDHHHTPQGGHSGCTKTLQRLRKYLIVEG